MDRTVRAVRTPGGARGDEQLPSHSLDARSRCPRFLPRGRSRCWCSATRTTCPARSRSWNSSSRCAFLRPGYICKCDDSNGTAPSVHHPVTSVRLPLGGPSKCNLRILPPSILKTRVAHSLMATRQRGFSVSLGCEFVAIKASHEARHVHWINLRRRSNISCARYFYTLRSKRRRQGLVTGQGALLVHTQQDRRSLAWQQQQKYENHAG